jgi:hypothetical protein
MVLEEVPMAIVGGLDLHRKQITFDVLDTVSAEVRRGRISPADRQLFRGWPAGWAGQHVELAVEGCTGWRFVIEECQAAGVVAHLAEPAEVAGLRGRRRHAKTDRIDARHLRDLLLQGRLPECWIPPQVVLETRAKVRLYRDLADQRTGWQQRLHATLYHLGAPAQRDLLSGDRDRLTRIAGLSPAARQAITVALSMIAALDAQIEPLRAELMPAGSRTPATRWATPGWTSPSTPPTANAHPGGCRATARRCCAGRCMRPPAARPAPPAPTTTTTARSLSGSVGNAPRCRSPANWPAAVTTGCALWASTPSRRRRPDPGPGGLSGHQAPGLRPVHPR